MYIYVVGYLFDLSLFVLTVYIFMYLITAYLFVLFVNKLLLSSYEEHKKWCFFLAFENKAMHKFYVCKARIV